MNRRRRPRHPRAAWIDFESAAPSTPCATSWIAMYRSVIASIATNTARGTVRAGSFTSPLGTSALSTPLNAKMSTIDARVTSPMAGGAAIVRFVRSTNERADEHEQEKRYQLRDGADAVETTSLLHA